MADLFGWLFICYGISGLVSSGVMARLFDFDDEASLRLICIGIISVSFCAVMAVGFLRRVEFVRKCGRGSFLIAIALVVISVCKADYIVIDFAICLASVLIPMFVFAFMLLGSTQVKLEFSSDDSLNKAAH